jgi:GT2 family glycosyltransferase
MAWPPIADVGQKEDAFMMCSVCVATYKRPDLLNGLLTSLTDQRLSHDVILEVIVVDNDASGAAEPVVRKYYHQQSHINFQYVLQPIKNISLARNTAVAHGNGEYMLFIDDDEIASPDWVMTLVGACAKHGADGVFGPAFPMFGPDTPGWLRDNAGRFVGAMPRAETGATADATWTSNCLLKAELLKSTPGPFDPEYGITGGEDTELFDRLKRRGARFIYCNEAFVFEHWPEERTRPSYFLRLSFRGGNGHTRRTISASKRPWWVRALMVSKAIVYGLISTGLVLGSFPSKAWRIYWTTRLASNAGRLLAVVGYHYKGYK